MVYQSERPSGSKTREWFEAFMATAYRQLRYLDQYIELAYQEYPGTKNEA